jgi:insulysin
VFKTASIVLHIDISTVQVHVGSLLDPPEFQGLAHFTEHMLFYSSEKYPVEDEYSKVRSFHWQYVRAS